MGAAIALLVSGCMGSDATEGATSALSEGEHTALISHLREAAETHDVTPIPPAPEVSDELFVLGQALMFDKVISGNRDISCMTCHFSTLGTDDDRHLASGVNGVDQGAERIGGALHPRNVLPLFNLHAMERFFWDIRLDSHGRSGQIRTEAGPEITPEMRRAFQFGPISALGMFPPLVRGEMRGQRFHNGPSDNELEGDLERPEVWERLMVRLGAIPEYRAMFEAAYPGTDFDEMTFAHASNAMAGFEIRAFESRGSRFQQFLLGDDTALTDEELLGAQIFFDEGCVNCHSGPLLSDMQVHNTALAQFGPGTEDGQYDNDDFGRASARGFFRLADERDGNARRERRGQHGRDRYAFRTAPLVNVTLTGPWGHVGQFSNLRDFVQHYDDPAAQLRSYDMAAQIAPGERHLLDMRIDNTEDVLARVDPLANVPVSDVDRVLAFLETLTDEELDLESTIPSRVPSGLPVLDGEAPPPDRGVAQGSVVFTNVAEAEDSGLDDYRRAPSAREAIAEDARQRSLTDPMHFFDIFDTPLRPRGMPGVVVFDYDDDGDEDVFATNGPGRANSLFSNQRVETGVVRFVDRAIDAGVAAVDTDNSGACYGDTDNDGDHDLFVVADHGRSHFFRNDGDGTFEDISATSGADVDGTGGTSCAFGDIDGDGLLDLFIARAWHQEDVRACFMDPFGAGIQHNELYVNAGDGSFIDVSHASGIRNIGGLPPWAAGAPTITWSVSMVDYDQDGDIDIFTADDQCALPPAAIGGVDRGFLQIFDNDGTGNFVNRTVEAGTNAPSAWMGLSFGDFNSDGYLDFFSPSFGDWGKLFAGAPVILGYETSRWYLGAPGKTFIAPGPGDLQRMPFGWGTTARDFDNDGDTDLTFHGGLDLFFHVDRSNSGTMLLNDGDANFGLDRDAFGANHARRNDAGAAAGDLDGDGFPDLVTISNFDVPASMPLTQYGGADTDAQFLSTFDPTAYFIPVFELVDTQPATKFDRLFTFNEDIRFDDGTIAVELNSADNGNGWVALRLVGSVGLATGGAANRDGIGATITFTPDGGRAVMAPVLGGASHLSQDSLTQGFGLGAATGGTAEILWPGGTRNRVYDIRSGESLTVPEIPCSYDTGDDRATYEACVDASLAELGAAGSVDATLGARLRASALRAYDEAH